MKTIPKKHPVRNKEQIKLLVNLWADKLNIQPTRVQVQKMKQKWASCSTTGWISLNRKLLKESRKFQDYVIIHELLHIKIPNHGKLFKTMMDIHYPYSNQT